MKVELFDSQLTLIEDKAVQTQKFVLVSQAVDKYDRDYLVRVWSLSRDTSFYNADALTRQFFLILAMNGLKNVYLHVILMAERCLVREELKRRLKGRSAAMSAVNVHNSYEGFLTSSLLSGDPVKRYLHADTSTYIPTYIHRAPPPLNIHTYIQTPQHTYLHTDTSTYIPTNTSTYIPTYIHTYRHLNIHTYIYT